MPYPLRFCFLQRVGPSVPSLMPKHLKRITGRGDLHFITFSCYQRRPLLASVRARDVAVQILNEVREDRHGREIYRYFEEPMMKIA